MVAELRYMGLGIWLGGDVRFKDEVMVHGKSDQG